MSHISFSALKIWTECPFKFKLTQIDRIAGFEGNHYTAFGSAVHNVCEQSILNENLNQEECFLESFIEELQRLPEHIRESLDQKMVDQMMDQGLDLLEYIRPSLEEYFGEYEIISTEEKLFEPIKDFKEADFDFKGFVDLVLKTPNGKYHVIDWKTCSWGWDSRKRSDPMVTYQLTLYKYYFAKKHNINLDDIETHFALLKRTSKKDKIEIFRVTSGNIKTNNAIKLLKKALYNIHSEKFVKNRLSCKRCEFYKTEHCP
jgi:hypothetical protein